VRLQNEMDLYGHTKDRKEEILYDRLVRHKRGNREREEIRKEDEIERQNDDSQQVTIPWEFSFKSYFGAGIFNSTFPPPLLPPPGI